MEFHIRESRGCMVLGVTGNIASGKSAAAAVLERFGAARVSADELSREIVAPGSAVLAAIVARFGSRILHPDGSLDRRRLGDIVFSNEEARRELEAITHPAIAELSARRLREAASCGPPLVVYEAPLLFEADARERVDRVLVIRVDPRVQLERLIRREGITREQAKQRIDLQMPQEKKAALADEVIDNSGTLAELEAELRRLWRRLVPEGTPPGP